MNNMCICCLQCRTDYGPELTRVSIVNVKMEVIYDKIVLPQLPIRDYLTQ